MTSSAISSPRSPNLSEESNPYAWEKVFDEQYQQYYYFNTKTAQSTWLEPKIFAQQQQPTTPAAQSLLSSPNVVSASSSLAIASLVTAKQVTGKNVEIAMDGKKVLKVKFDTDTGMYKAHLQDPTQTIKTVIKSILMTKHSNVNLDNYAFLLASSDSKAGRWLLNQNEKIETIPLKENSTVWVIKKNNTVRVLSFAEEQLLEIPFDETQPVSELIIKIAEAAKIEKAMMNEFALKRTDRPFSEWLSPNLSLREQIACTTSGQPFSVIFGKRYYSNDKMMSIETPNALNLSYIQARRRFLTEDFSFVWKSQIAELADLVALQAAAQQVKPPLSSLEGYVPERIANGENTAKILSEANALLKKMKEPSKLKAQYDFLKKCEFSSMYAFQLFEVRQNAIGKKVILGISDQSIVVFDSKTKQLCLLMPLHNLHHHSATSFQIHIVVKKFLDVAKTRFAEDYHVFDTVAAHIIDETLTQTMIHKATSTNSTALPASTFPTNSVPDIRDLLKNTSLVSQAYASVAQLERLYFNAGPAPYLHSYPEYVEQVTVFSLGDADVSRHSITSDDLVSDSTGTLEQSIADLDNLASSKTTSSHSPFTLNNAFGVAEQEEAEAANLLSLLGIPTLANIETELLCNLTKLKAHVKILEMHKKFLNARLAVTAVGSYSESVEQLKKQIEEQNVTVENAKEIISKQMADLMAYEDYVNLKYERAAKKEQRLRDQENNIIKQKMELMETQQELAEQASKFEEKQSSSNSTSTTSNPTTPTSGSSTEKSSTLEKLKKKAYGKADRKTLANVFSRIGAQTLPTPGKSPTISSPSTEKK